MNALERSEKGRATITVTLSAEPHNACLRSNAAHFCVV